MQEVKLYINNMEVEFSTSPDILFTFQEDDLTNPTIVKNSYTKTLQIKGTAKNNDIFGQIWDLPRIQGNSNFNSTKRVPFELYVNGNVYQKGYAKLDNINRRNKEITYDLTLYGGLGSFLYNLSTDWNTGDKKSLADLKFYTYPGSDEEVDLSFTINKDTVASAWTQIQSNDKWGKVNFAPSYNGIPENISADKVLINFNNSSLESGVTSGGTNYTATQGYALGTLPEQLTSEQVRDYRSYLQTPVIRVKDIIESICDPRNNSGLYDNGYEVELDNDFFTSSNPYYWDSWMTLPLLTSLEYTSKGSGESSAYTGNFTRAYASNGGYTYTFELDEPITGVGQSIKVNFELVVSANTTSDNLYMYYTRLKGRATRVYYPNAYGVQLFTSDDVTYNGSALSGSRIKWLSGEQVYEYNDAVSSGQYSPKFNAGVDVLKGSFTRKNGNIFKFTSNIELECDLPAGTTCFKIDIGRCNKSNNAERTQLFTSTQANTGQKIDTNITNIGVPFGDTSITISTIDDSEFFSNKYISKDMLLGTDYSPADWLLSYCKMFGLYLYKDIVEDKIYIKTRNNYYLRDTVIDIDDDVDRGDNMDINPVYCENGYLSLTNTGVTSRVYDDYNKKYGKVYGQKIINTGYEFNADNKELINSVFQNAVQTKEVSQYFYRPNSLHQHPYIKNGMSYLLYADGISDGETYEYKITQNEISEVFTPYIEEYPGYDYIAKPMFADGDNNNLDTGNVLLFFNGYTNVIGFDWYLTDDISMMYKLNNNPTWLMTSSEEDIYGNTIAKAITNIPNFSRWYEGNNWMIYSMDFGSPREIYVPDMVNNEEGNVYYNYFKKYYTDLYDVDTKVVDCYVKELEFNAESLRKFYWFENTIWRLNKITDYNPTNHRTTKCQFVKVQSLDNMTNEDASSELWVKVELDKYIANQSGDTIIGTVKTSDNGPWNIEGWNIVPSVESGETYELTIDPMSYSRRGNFYVTVPENTGYDKRVTIYVTAGDIGGSVEFIQRGAKVAFIVEPNPLNFAGSGGTLNLNITNPFGYEWRIVGYPGWTTISNMSGSGETTLTVTTSANTGVERTDSIVFYLPESDRTVVVEVNQDIVPNITLNPTSIVFDASGGTATIDVTSNVCWNVKLSGETSLTGLTIDNFAWISDFPYSAGSYQTKDYSTFNIMAHYDDGTSVDVTNDAIVSGLITLEENTGTTRRTVFAPIAANYQGLNKAELKTGYQAANVPLPTDYLTFEILGYNGTFILGKSGYSVEYRVNGGAWNTASTQTTLNVSGGDIIEVRGDNDRYSSNTDSYMFGGTSSFNVYGNIMSLISSTNFANLTELTGIYAFRALFMHANVVDASELILPATTLSNYCYRSMFQDCTGLTTAPSILPATTLTDACYYNMFYGCSSLRQAPELPATTLAYNCYYSMFQNCSSLTTAPELPATILANRCYYGMFWSCTSLNYIKCLATDMSAGSCTTNWVNNVASTGTFIKNPDMTGWSTGYNGIPTGWTVIDDGDYTTHIVNNTSTQISGTIVGLGTPDTISIDSGETLNRYDNLPIDITEAYLTGLGLDSGTLTLSNGSEYIDCVWDSNNNVFMGDGSITLSSTNNTLTITYNS